MSGPLWNNVSPVWFCGLTKSCLERLQRKAFGIFPLTSSILNHTVKSARHFKFDLTLPGLKNDSLNLGNALLNSNIHTVVGFLRGEIITSEILTSCLLSNAALTATRQALFNSWLTSSTSNSLFYSSCQKSTTGNFGFKSYLHSI